MPSLFVVEREHESYSRKSDRYVKTWRVVTSLRPRALRPQAQADLEKYQLAHSKTWSSKRHKYRIAEYARKAPKRARKVSS